MEVVEKKHKTKYSVPAVENALIILRLLSRKRYQESTLTEIANAVSLSPATCFRILNSLEKSGVVRFIKDRKKYTLGPYLVVLGERAKEHLDYISIIKPYLEELTKQTGFTSVLVNKIGEDKLTFVSKVEAEDYGVKVSIGRNFAITDGSFGICFMAYLEEQEREYHLKSSRGLKNFSGEEIKSLEEDYEKVRRDGYSVTYGEYIKGISGISAPIFNDQHQVEMVVSLFCITAQLNEEITILNGSRVREVAREISEKLFMNIEA